MSGTGRGTGHKACLTLLVCWGVFFTQYANVAILAAFFPDSPFGQKVGAGMVGLTFAAYPLATAAAIPVPPMCIMHFGSRLTVFAGLALAAAGSLLLGLLPAALGADSSAAVLSVTFVGCRLLGGFGAALAEAGCFTALSTSDYGKQLGLVMSSVELVIGVGAAGGTAAGGVLNEVGEHTALGPWRLPFIVSAAATVALLPLVFALPGKSSTEVRPTTTSTTELEASDGEAEAAVEERVTVWSVCTRQRLFALASLFFGSANIEASGPILQPYAAAPPLRMNNGRIGLIIGARRQHHVLPARRCSAAGMGLRTRRRMLTWFDLALVLQRSSRSATW